MPTASNYRRGSASIRDNLLARIETVQSAKRSWKLQKTVTTEHMIHRCLRALPALLCRMHRSPPSQPLYNCLSLTHHGVLLLISFTPTLYHGALPLSLSSGTIPRCAASPSHPLLPHTSAAFNLPGDLCLAPAVFP